MELKRLCKAKETVTWKKWHARDWAGIIPHTRTRTHTDTDTDTHTHTHPTGQEKLDTNKSNNPILKCGTEINRMFI